MRGPPSPAHPRHQVKNATEEAAMNPAPRHHPAARMAGRADGAGMLAATNTVTGDMATSLSRPAAPCSRAGEGGRHAPTIVHRGVPHAGTVATRCRRGARGGEHFGAGHHSEHGHDRPAYGHV